MQRSLRIGIVGPPNAGKSVLTNQLLYYDTPGLSSERSHYPSSNDSRRMMARSWEVVERCDVVMLIIDAERQLRMPDKRVDRLLSLIDSQLPGGKTRVVCLNKVDLVKEKRKLLELPKKLEGRMEFDQLFMISALKGRGLRALESYLRGEAVSRPWEEDPLKSTRQSPVDMANEIVRECLLDRLHQELPYRVHQRQVSRRQLADGSMRIEMELAVDTEGQRGIVVGKNGQSIRQIGMAARKQLEVLFGITVHLILRAVVRKQR